MSIGDMIDNPNKSLKSSMYSAGYRAGAEAMREAAIKLHDSPDVCDIDEYADCIRALPLPSPK